MFYDRAKVEVQYWHRQLRLKLVRKRGIDRTAFTRNRYTPGYIGSGHGLALTELALDFCRRVLIPGGDFLVKVFEGSGKEQFVTQLRGSFSQVMTRKPKASRPGSREVYLLGRQYVV